MSTGLFASLGDLSYRRNWKQAIAFYVVWFIPAMLGGGVAGMVGTVVLGITDPQEAFRVGVRCGAIWACLYCATFAAAMLWNKKSYSPLSIICLLLAPGLALLGGGLVGLVPVAYLSTLPTPADKGNDNTDGF